MLPWKSTKDPYIIWLSEIILQQTRVAQGTPYFLAFTKAFPSVHDLANAPQDEVMRLWEGLGYYSRARNLHTAAKYISRELDGVFPDTYQTILKLKGVGPYTAAAIASFAYDLPHAVVDGNVYRVLSRYFGIETPIDTSTGKKTFAELADQILDREDPASYNQAIMNFGSMQCVPKNPDCGKCPLQSACRAFEMQKVTQLPIKSKKIKRKDRYFYFLLCFNEAGEIAINRRGAGDIWQGLYQFPLFELEQAMNLEDIVETLKLPKELEVLSISKTYKQILTHQTIYARFIEVEQKQKSPEILSSDAVWKLPSALVDIAFPKVVNRFIEDRFDAAGYSPGLF